MDEEWALTDEQFDYLHANAGQIQEAFVNMNYPWLDAFAEGEGFRQKFGAMSFDEAWDRYLSAVDPRE